MYKAPPVVNLTRKRGSTLRYRASSWWFRMLASFAAAAVIAGAVVWQLPNINAAVQEWAVGTSGQSELLSAQAGLSDTLALSDDTLSDTEGDVVSTAELRALIDECRAIRTNAESVDGMRDCVSHLIQTSGYLAVQNDRYATAVETTALVKEDAEEKARVKAAAAAKKKAAAEKAERERLEQEAKRNQQQQNRNPPRNNQGNPAPPPPSNPGGGGGQSLSATVVCNGPATVSASASGGGSVSIRISGPGSNSSSGSGGASVSASGGAGTYTISASSSSGGVSINPSWSGNCR